MPAQEQFPKAGGAGLRPWRLLSMWLPPRVVECVIGGALLAALEGLPPTRGDLVDGSDLLTSWMSNTALVSVGYIITLFAAVTVLTTWQLHQRPFGLGIVNVVVGAGLLSLWGFYDDPTGIAFVVLQSLNVFAVTYFFAKRMTKQRVPPT